MKTPREILLERHRAAETKLDAIRENVVATAVSGADAVRPAAQSFPLRTALMLWRELVLPCRPIWAGVAAVWLVILALHLSTGTSPKMAAGQMAASGPDVLMTLREQKEILAEMTAPVAPPPVSPPPPARPAVPGPRGDRQPVIRPV
jgi:hypothetical protein